MNLSGHKVLITGGSSGVGLHLARRLVERGNAVLICGRDPGKLAAAAASMPGVHTTTADLGDAEALPRLLGEAEQRLGGLSLLVNNAAIQLNYHLATRPAARTLADIDDELAVDLAAPIKLTALALPLLVREPAAAVLNVTTGLALSPKRSAAVYAAAKAGLRTFTRALRYQLAVDAPHVRAVEAMLPLVDTPMTAGRGTGKITAAQAADEILTGLAAGRDLVAVGKVKPFLLLHRLAPGRADALLRDG